MTLLQKLERYCSYQDRCTRDIEMKMSGWKIPKASKEKLIKQLKDEGFIDDQRFARSFVRGKFRVNKWGRIRIAFELRSRQLPEAIITEALLEIGEEEYMETIRALVNRKSGEINPEKTLNKREKIINFVVGKGFETDLVLRMIKEIKN
jgi:regulatory protein